MQIKLSKAQLIALRNISNERQDRFFAARYLAKIFKTNVIRKHDFEGDSDKPVEVYELQANAEGVNVFFDFDDENKVSIVETLVKVKNGSGFYTIFNDRYVFRENKWYVESSKTVKTVIKAGRQNIPYTTELDNNTIEESNVVNSGRVPKEYDDYDDYEEYE